jgi:hypothetical protein
MYSPAVLFYRKLLPANPRRFAIKKGNGNDFSRTS